MALEGLHRQALHQAILETRASWPCALEGVTVKLFKLFDRWFDFHCPELPDLGDYSSNLLASLLTMAWLVEARDPYTGGHLWRVSMYARLLAERAGFNDADASRISLGGFLHDLGKVSVPDDILRKPDALTAGEYAIIKTHPEMGIRMIAGHPLAGLVSDAIRHHHERPDGHGYPNRLLDSTIPEVAKVVGICDAFDAMTSERPYRHGMPLDEASTIIRKLSGAQFSSRYATLFVTMCEEGSFDAIVGHSDHGIPLLVCPQCGPTLTVRREQGGGARIYCHSCGAEFVLETSSGNRVAKPTGMMGTASQLQIETDAALVARTVRTLAGLFPMIDFHSQYSQFIGQAQ